jgi:hypothetical protein
MDYEQLSDVDKFTNEKVNRKELLIFFQIDP